MGLGGGQKGYVAKVYVLFRSPNECRRFGVLESRDSLNGHDLFNA